MFAGPRLEFGLHVLCAEAERGEYLRGLLEARLPRLLHWIIRKPRLLKAVFRIAPRLKPRLTEISVDATNKEEAVAQSKHWLAEREAVGAKLSGGYAFTYTNERGWPAEVYGPATAVKA